MAALGVQHLAFLEPSELQWFVVPFIMRGEGELAEAAARARRDRDMAARMLALGETYIPGTQPARTFIDNGGNLDATVAEAVANNREMRATGLGRLLLEALNAPSSPDRSGSSSSDLSDILAMTDEQLAERAAHGSSSAAVLQAARAARLAERGEEADDEAD